MTVRRISSPALGSGFRTALLACYRRRRRRRVLEKAVRPRDEVLPVGPVGMAAVVLAPGELPVQQTDVDRRHLLGLVVVRTTEVFVAKQPEHRLRGDDRHEAAMLI